MAKKTGKQKPVQGESGGRFEDAPDDLYHSATAQMPLSRYGQDRGAVKRPLKQVAVDTADGVSTARRVKDGIDRLREKGTIGRFDYDAARLFQDRYAQAGYDRIACIKLGGAGGGGMGIEEAYSRSVKARDGIAATFDLLGGAGSSMSKAVHFYVGMGHSLRDIKGILGDSTDYWRGVLICALRIMGDDHIKNLKKSKRRLVSSTPRNE